MSSSERDVSRRGFLRTAVGAGAVGAAVAAGGNAAAQDGGTTTVDMTDGLVFDPDEISIAPGDTVVWENVGSIGHSVTAYEEDIPGEAEYFASGGFDSEQAARDAYPDGDIGGGGTYEHTFEVEGTYEYFCIPHESAGMLGTVNVGTGGGGDGGGGGGGGGGPPPVPESAVSLVIGGSMALVTALGFVYFFLKYGGDYEAGE